MTRKPYSLGLINGLTAGTLIGLAVTLITAAMPRPSTTGPVGRHQLHRATIPSQVDLIFDTNTGDTYEINAFDLGQHQATKVYFKYPPIQDHVQLPVSPMSKTTHPQK